MTTIYFAGGEDSEFTQLGGCVVGTTSGYFRSAYARCYLQCPFAGGWWQNCTPWSAVSTLWASARCVLSGGNTGATASGTVVMGFCDASGILRLRWVQQGGTNAYRFEKVTAAGVATQLGSNFTYHMVDTSGLTDKIDVAIFDDATAGSITIYVNGAVIFSVSGVDTTTNGVSTLSYIQLGGPVNVTNTLGRWSEIIVADSDTRSMSLQTLAPVANGNTHNFDTGSPAAANVSEVTLSDTTVDGSSTAGQIDEYTIPSLVSGVVGIVAVGVSARLVKGASGPSKMDLAIRSGSTDYYSSDQVLSTSWGSFQNWWATDPNIGAAWAALPANIGLKSVT